MNDIVLGGILIFFILLIIGRRVGDKNEKAMACKERDRLLESFARFRTVQIVPLAVILAWYFAGTRLFDDYGDAVLYSVFGLLCVYLVGVNAYVYLQLRREGYPPTYLNGFLVSRSLTFAGLLVLVAALIIGRQ